MIERRVNPSPLDIAGTLAMLYTLGYFVMVGFLFFVGIPTANRDPVLTLVGLMSAVQMAIIGFYYGSSKNAESTQRAVIQQQARTVEAIAAVSNGNGKAPLKTEVMNVDAKGADVNINK